MKTDGKPSNGEGDDRRPRPFVERRKSSVRKRKDYVERATAAGHSGYGLESVRPHLRDQLKLKELLTPSTTYPLPHSGEGQTGNGN